MYDDQKNVTVIVPASQTPHTDSYNPSNPAAPASSPSKRTIGIPGVVAVCLLTSIVTCLLCLLIYNFMGGDEGGTKLTGPGVTQGTTLSNQGGANQTGDVTIQVENVTSPATAVAKKVLTSIAGIQITATANSWQGSSTYVAGEGSGVVFSADGYIITNYHVIQDMLTSTGDAASNVSLNVYLYTDPNTAIPGNVVGYDIGADLAIVKIDRTGLTPVELGDSDALQVGDIAIALGNPGGLQFLGSVSQGIISGLNRTIQTESAYENLTLIQTDAAINPGNSGGALVDVSGKLIGINSVKLVAEEYEGMGFAIPVNDVVAICTELIKNGNQKTPYLGAEISSDYTAEYLERLGYPGGILVESVASGSPAETGGMKVEDIIVSFNGTTVRSASDLRNAKNEAKSGDTVIIRVYRLTKRTYFGRWEGEYIDISVTLG
ncbi:MAG: trypsin-like peptidase domain-containing protein [Clostridia bacterium]|nr:trypsin-like peptidase domain-containing protein [Clostridia bacterium]